MLRALAQNLESGGDRVNKPCGGRGISRKCKAEFTGSVLEPSMQEQVFEVCLMFRAVFLNDAEVHIPEEVGVEQTKLCIASAAGPLDLIL